jgi:thioredoxin 1
MKATWKIVLIAALTLAIVAVVALKERQRTSLDNRAAEVPAAQGDEPNATVERKAALPRLVELGADKCVPCKMMAPILEELRSEYAGRLQVDFYDVWKNPGIAQQYGVEAIPTQIFYDTSGQELFRHLGYIAKADILAKWHELGVNLSPTP